MSLQVKIGADPETFLMLGKNFISAHGIVPGTKEEPFKVERGAVQVDGLAFEYNIDPATTAEEFDKNHSVVQEQMKEILAKVDKDIKIVFKPVAKFDVKYFKDLPQNSKVLGCDPDFECNRGSVIVKDVDLTDIPVRTAAGHVHVGWTEDQDAMSSVHFEDARFVANYFYQDYSNPFRMTNHEEIERLRYYGYPGAFRPKSYGVELRQYSNLWVEHSEKRKLMFNYVANKVTNLYKG